MLDTEEGTIKDFTFGEVGEHFASFVESFRIVSIFMEPIVVRSPEDATGFGSLSDGAGADIGKNEASLFGF